MFSEFLTAAGLKEVQTCRDSHIDGFFHGVCLTISFTRDYTLRFPLLLLAGNAKCGVCGLIDN